MKHQNPSRSLSYGYQCLEDSSLSGLAKQCDSLGERKSDNHKMNFAGSKKVSFIFAMETCFPN